MAAMKKIAGLIAGVSAVAVFGVAIAQGNPPNPFIADHGMGAGQQSTHLTPMGETGVPVIIDQVQTAQSVTVQETAQVAETPAPVAEAPAPVQEQQQMGAAPAEPAPVAAEPAPLVAKADRG